MSKPKRPFDHEGAQRAKERAERRLVRRNRYIRETDAEYRKRLEAREARQRYINGETQQEPPM